MSQCRARCHSAGARCHSAGTRCHSAVQDVTVPGQDVTVPGQDVTVPGQDVTSCDYLPRAGYPHLNADFSNTMCLLLNGVLHIKHN